VLVDYVDIGCFITLGVLITVLDQYYKKLYAMLFDALKQAAPGNCQGKQLDNAVVILLPFIEGYRITSSNLDVSTKNCPNN
jgi:hypothetical protein